MPGIDMEEDVPTGWVKPVAKPTRESLQARVAELRAELAQAEAQLRAMEDDTRLEALVKIRNLMRAFSFLGNLLPVLLPVGVGARPAASHSCMVCSQLDQSLDDLLNTPSASTTDNSSMLTSPARVAIPCEPACEPAAPQVLPSSWGLARVLVTPPRRRAANMFTARCQAIGSASPAGCRSGFWGSGKRTSGGV